MTCPLDCLEDVSGNVLPGLGRWFSEAVLNSWPSCTPGLIYTNVHAYIKSFHFKVCLFFLFQAMDFMHTLFIDSLGGLF